MIGQTVSHYRIIEKLGEGGMGIVYRAEDIKLGRCVAIKALPQNLVDDNEARTRFVHEAKAASSLDHPNICTIYEIDDTGDGGIFMVMAYYDGRTVKEHLARGPLDIARALDIATGVACGLERAHERGIVHRDIKPANIMVASDGVAKIMDFGIAKLASQATITRVGSSLGTVAYMSPEQASGSAQDHRTDIWSLGVLLYEMLTGRRPFTGEYDQAVIYSILNETPGSPVALRREIPAGLERIVMRAMAKEAGGRFQSAGEMRAALEECSRSITAGASVTTGADKRQRPSIAVLPFKDMSPRQDQEYFCVGIAEELLNSLVQIEGLRVAARTSSEQFKGRGMDVRAIGRELGVRSVLEGSVRTAGNRLRITAQLINVEDGYHLFSEKYDRTADDIFAIQDDISLAIVDKLKVKLLEGEESKLTKRHTENEEAYRLYLQGRYFWNRRHEGGMQQGLEYFQKAIAVDPEYVLPYSGIADCYFSLAWFTFLAPKVAFPKCREAALKALEMDPDLAEAHASLAHVLMFFDWDPDRAEAEFRRAIALNPNYAIAHYFYSLLLTARGRFDEAIAEQTRAIELDPIQPIIRAVRGFTLWIASRREAAVAESRALIEFDPEFWIGWILRGWVLLGISGVEDGALPEAEDAIRKADALMAGGSTFALGSLGYVLGMAGKREEARAVLDGLLELRKSKYVAADMMASIFWFLGERDAAFEWLERAIDERSYQLCFAKYMPRLRVMGADPRYSEILRRLRLDTLP